MGQPNRILAMLARKQVPLGIQCFLGNETIVELVGRTGFDFVMFDSEHSSNDPRAMEHLIRAADTVGLASYVRVPSVHDETAIRRALESGAEGIYLPMVKSVRDVEIAAEAAFFPPMGTRGICPAIRAGGYSFRTFQDYADWNNEEVALVPMIEHPEGVEAVDEICALDCVKMIVFGAGDLAFAMGESTQMMKSPKVQAAYKHVLESAARHGVAVVGGPVLNPTPEACRKAIEDGVSIFCLGLDTLGFRKFCEQVVTALNEGVAGTGYERAPAPLFDFVG